MNKQIIENSLILQLSFQPEESPQKLCGRALNAHMDALNEKISQEVLNPSAPPEFLEKILIQKKIFHEFIKKAKKFQSDLNLLKEELY